MSLGTGQCRPDKLSSDCTRPVAWRSARRLVLDGQTKLDGGIRERGAASALAAGSGKPVHVLFEPPVSDPRALSAAL